MDTKKEALGVHATEKNFPQKKHALIQAILSVNEMVNLSTSQVSSLFVEDIMHWLDKNDIRYTENISLMGKSGYSRTFDFLIPKSSKAPERLIKPINNPSKAAADSLIMAWEDTKSTRRDGSKAYAFVNDNLREDIRSFTKALDNYGINSIPWTKRENYKEMLAA